MLISVIVPCRNEVQHIDSFLEGVCAQKLEAGDRLEVIIADGMSDDGTRERLSAWQTRMRDLVVIENTKKITSAALNGAIEKARGEFIIRMDVHTIYAPDYVSQCVRALKDTGATCVGGPWRPEGEHGLQRAIALAFSSRFGSGGAQSRRVDYTGPVDTVYLGAWRRKDLLRLGGFDETLVRNQDDELNLRILRSGGTVWQCAAIRSTYRPRASLAALFRQFYQYGYWKVPVIRKHRLPASARHLAPAAFLGAIALSLLTAPFAPYVGLAGCVLVAVYLAAAFASTLAIGEPGASWNIVRALMCMHFGYGLGFSHGILDFMIRCRAPSEFVTRLTR